MLTDISERTLPLQGIRVLLMIGIVCAHVWQYPVWGDGRDLVPFFFVVSGFLYRDKLSWGTYMKKKMIGIYPLFWIVLLLSELICFIRGVNNISWTMIPHVFLLQSWYPDIWYSFAYVTVAWFMSSLLFCYAMSHILYKYVISHLSSRRSKVALVVLCVIILLLDLLRVEPQSPLFVFREWLIYVSPVYCLLEYSLGMLLWQVVKEKKYHQLSKKYESLVVLLLMVYSFGIYANGGALTTISHVMMIGCVYLFNSKLVTLLFGNKYIVWLSTYVMFVYMSHQSLTINCFRSRVDSNVLLVVLCFVFGIIFGKLYNRFVKPRLKNL